MEEEANATNDSADDALVLEEVDEYEYEGRIGGFLSERSTIYLRFYGDGTLDGNVRQRKKPSLNGLALLSTSKKRKLQTYSSASKDHYAIPSDSMLCGYIQGRWLRRGDGHVCHFKAMKRQGHVDRQTLTCRAELFNDGRATGTWQLPAETHSLVKKERTESGSETETEDDEDKVIENVFEWLRVDHSDGDTASTMGQSASAAIRSQDPLTLYPLTPGTYRFKGFTAYGSTETVGSSRANGKDSQKKKKTEAKKTGKQPPRDECLVSMELLADGTLKGKSREVAYPQSCTITGTWEIGRVRYVLEYKVRGAVGYFKYSGRVSTPSEDDGDETESDDEGAGPKGRVLKGKWRNVDDGQVMTPGYTGGRGYFELACVHRSTTTMEDGEEPKKETMVEFDDDDQSVVVLGAVRVFTTGSYVLKGVAIDEDGYEYESHVDVELLADGSVRGACRELVFQQIQRISGSWTRTTMEYELEYVVKKEVGRYFYKGKLDDDGLVVHGAWCNMELLFDETNGQNANYRGEKGTFSYAILESTRRWSVTSHRDFPTSFKDRVRCVLLCSQRNHVLPNALWSNIFVFCGLDWFQVPITPRIKQE